jgi:hypothetical protein
MRLSSGVIFVLDGPPSIEPQQHFFDGRDLPGKVP